MPGERTPFECHKVSFPCKENSNTFGGLSQRMKGRSHDTRVSLSPGTPSSSFSLQLHSYLLNNSSRAAHPSSRGCTSFSFFLEPWLHLPPSIHHMTGRNRLDTALRSLHSDSGLSNRTRCNDRNVLYLHCPMQKPHVALEI